MTIYTDLIVDEPKPKDRQAKPPNTDVVLYFKQVDLKKEMISQIYK